MKNVKRNSGQTKVLVLTTTFPRWRQDATPPFIYDLSQKLASEFEIIVLAPHYPQAKFKEKMDNLQVYRFPYFFPLKFQRLCYEGGILPNIKSSFLARIQVPFLVLSELIFAWRLAQTEKPDLIHAHWTPQGLLALIIRLFLGIPVVVTAHAGDVFSQNPLFRHLNYLVAKSANAVTVNSQATKKALIQANQEFSHLSIIPMGVDFGKFKPATKKRIKKIKIRLGLEKKRLILFVGRWTEKKGIPYLIKAMPKILTNIPNAHLLIIGYGPEEKNLKVLTRELNLEKKISFLGKVPHDQLPNYYSLCDLFVAPSIQTKKGDTEGLGVVMLEAIASGATVVGSRIGGIPEIIHDQKTGLLVEPRNSDQLAKAIIKMLKNEKLRKQFGQKARKDIESRFGWKTVAKEFSEIYYQIIR